MAETHVPGEIWEPGSLLPNEWLMVVLYLAGMLYMGYRVKEEASQSIAETFLAGRKIPAWIISLSTVATNLNANDFIGWAGAVYISGVAMLHFPLQTAIVICFLGMFVMRNIRASNAYTLAEWLGKRYSPSIGQAYAIIWLFVWMPFALGLWVYAGSLVLHTLVGWNLYASIIGTTVLVAAYTLMGGYRAVVATDVLQLIFMFLAVVIMCGLIWLRVGSPMELVDSLTGSKADLWTSNSRFGSIGTLWFGHLAIALCFWSCDAQLVQRPLSSRNPDEAAISYVGAGFWYALLVPFLAIYPGLAAIKLFPTLPKNDFAFPMLFKEFLPAGVYGVAIVGLISGAFSTISSTINAYCTMYTTEVHRQWINRNATDEQLLIVSRYAGIALAATGIFTAIIFSLAESMFLLLAAIIATVMPPIGAVTVLGALSRRWSPRGALAGLVGGFLVAIGLLSLDMLGQLSNIAQDTSFFRAFITFVCTIVITVLVSYLEQLNSFALGSNAVSRFPFAPNRSAAIAGPASAEVKVTCVLLASVILAVYCTIAIELGRSHP